jgi:4-aminobutyrate aminotransferase-like enzyme
MAFVIDDISFALRTPELFSFRYFTNPKNGAELSPDVLVLGKGIAAVYPLSMVLSKKGF